MEQEKFWDSIYTDASITDIEYLIRNGLFYPLYNPAREFSHTEGMFADRLKGIRNSRVLSVGGGIDKVALYLAMQGNVVTAVDVSRQAVDTTLACADRLEVRGKIDVLHLDWEEASLGRKFDVVIVRNALHHMNRERAMGNIHDVLDEGGLWIGMEPVCLTRAIRFLHRRFPFHPYPFSADEHELNREDLSLIESLFTRLDITFFDCLTRESVSFFLYRIGFREVIRKLGKFDFRIIATFPVLRYASTWSVFIATK